MFGGGRPGGPMLECGSMYSDIQGIMGNSVTGSRFKITSRKSTWVRMIYCLQIIWRENRKSQWRLWSATILHRAGCD